MERKEYLEWCRDCAILPNGPCGIKRNVPENRKVMVDGLLYYPEGYCLRFDDRGNVIHTAILHDLHANSVVCCLLSKVSKGDEEKQKYE